MILIEKWSWIAGLLAASIATLAKAESRTPLTYLSPEECFVSFSAVIESERINYGNDYPFLFHVRGSQAKTLLKYQSAWLDDEPSERRPARKLMEVMGFRTPGIWALICEVNISSEMPSRCLIGMVRENVDQESIDSGFYTSLEFLSGSRCDALFDLM